MEQQEQTSDFTDVIFQLFVSNLFLRLNRVDGNVQYSGYFLVVLALQRKYKDFLALGRKAFLGFQ